MHQIQIRILEGRQLAGTQIDPVCTVNVGNQKKSTTIKEQTNCPFWDEVSQILWTLGMVLINTIAVYFSHFIFLLFSFQFFVFDFKMPPMVLFDKIINFQVFVTECVTLSFF